MMPIAIVGMARTGIACAEVLLERGARVSVFEREEGEKQKQSAVRLRAAGADVTLGTDIPRQDTRYEAFIVSPGIKPDHPLFDVAREKDIPVWSEIEMAYRIAKAPIIAVSGTNGKSTTCALIHHLLKSAGEPAWLCGNLAGSEKDLPLISAAHQAQPGEWLVAEVSSFQLLRTDRFKPRIAVLTNLGIDHLDYHGSWENYAKAKSRLFQAQTDEDWLIVNDEDDGTKRLMEMLSDENFDSLSALQKSGHLLWMNARQDSRADRLRSSLSPALPGYHNLQNALMAAACAGIVGLSFESILKSLQTYQGLPHRMEFVEMKRGVIYINNSMCTNADALFHSLDSLSKPPIAIIGGFDKSQEGERIAEIAAAKSKAVLVIGTNVSRLLQRLEELNKGEYVETLARAVKRAAQIAEPGDTVILAPALASFDQFVDFVDRGEQFKSLVRQL